MRTHHGRTSLILTFLEMFVSNAKNLARAT
jgi:hypothetical protein